MANKSIEKAGKGKSNALAKRGGSHGDWKEKLKKYAKEVQESAPVSGTFASIKDGLYIGGQRMEDDKAQVVVLGYVCENQYFPVPYNKDDPKPPSCYAVGKNDKELVPAENARGYWDSDAKEWVKPDTCAECPMNEWGSAEQGNGKACKNTRLVGFISANGLEEAEQVETADLVQLSVPPTSLKPFNTYLRNTAQAYGHPMLAVTEVRAEQEDWDMVYFESQEHLPEELWDALEARKEAVEEQLLARTHEEVPEEDPIEANRKNKRPGKRGGGRDERAGKERGGKDRGRGREEEDSEDDSREQRRGGGREREDRRGPRKPSKVGGR